MTNGLQIVHYGHSCVLINTGSARLLFDPGTLSPDFEELRDLDAILVTHQHPDHLDVDRLTALTAANPTARLIVDPGSASQLSLDTTTANPGDAFEFAGAAINVVGGEHAQIHPEVPVPPNVGYLVDHGAFYHPGDSLFVPEGPVDVLGLPAAAPWLKTAEAVEFQRAVSPRVSIPIHDGILSDVGRQFTIGNWLTNLAPTGTRVRQLTRLEPTEV